MDPGRTKNPSVNRVQTHGPRHQRTDLRSNTPKTRLRLRLRYLLDGFRHHPGPWYPELPGQTTTSDDPIRTWTEKTQHPGTSGRTLDRNLTLDSNTFDGNPYGPDWTETPSGLMIPVSMIRPRTPTPPTGSTLSPDFRTRHLRSDLRL